MKKIIASIVIVAYIVSIWLLLFRPNMSVELFDGIMYFLGIVAFISFLFGYPEKVQLYKFWPKGEILMNTPIWFKTLWGISLLFVFYLFFTDGLKGGWSLILIPLALGTGYLAPYLFVPEITVE